MQRPSSVTLLALLAAGCGPASTPDLNPGLRDRLQGCETAINLQDAEVGNSSACLKGKYCGTVLLASTPCSAELTDDGGVHFTAGAEHAFQRPFLYEGYTRKAAPVGPHSTTGFSIIWRADSTDGQSLVLDFNSDLRDGLQLRHTQASSETTCFLTVR